jgi:AcrR family transcriptional regulator
MPKIVDVYEKKKENHHERYFVIFPGRVYYDTIMKDIADATGMGRSSLYEYFKNREEIFRFSVDVSVDNILKEIGKISEQGDKEFEEKIAEFVNFLMADFVKDRYFAVIFGEYWLKMIKNNEDLSHIYSRRQNIRDNLAELLQEGIKKGELKPHDAHHFSDLLYIAIESLCMNSMINPDCPGMYRETLEFIISLIKR